MNTPNRFPYHYLLGVLIFGLVVLVFDNRQQVLAVTGPGLISKEEVLGIPTPKESQTKASLAADNDFYSPQPQTSIHLSQLTVAESLPKDRKQLDVSAFSYWQRVNCLSQELRLGREGTCRAGYDTFALQPGDVMFLEVNASQALHVSSQNTKLNRHDLTFSVSNGTGLFIELEPIYDPNSQSFHLQMPADNNTQLCRISRPVHHPTSIDLVLSLSRTVSTPPPLVAREEIALVDIPFELQGTLSDGVTLGLINPFEKKTIQVHGPAIMVFEHHLLFRDQDGSRQAEYRLAANLLDRQGMEVDRKILEFESLPEQNQLMSIAGKAVVVGRLQRVPLSVPEGDYTLVLTPTRTLFARLLNEQQPAYLLGKFNSPKHQTVAQQLHSRNILSIEPAWYLENLQSQDLISDGIFSVEKLMQISRRLSIDNHYQPGGQAGATLLQQAVLKRPAWQAYFKGIPEQVAPNTFFRNLLPQDKVDPLTQHFAWFTSPRLKTAIDHHLVVGAQHYPEMFSMLGNATFTSLPSSPGNDQKTVNYVLPPRSTDSLLRLVALYPDDPTDLELSMDGGKPYRLHMQTKPDYPENRYRLNLAEAGLAILQQQFPQYDRGTLGGPFSLFETPGPLINVATTEIHLPATVRSLKLKRLSSAQQPLWLALQYRDAKFHTLSETDFLHALKLLGGREQLLGLFANWLSGKNALLDKIGKADLEALAQKDLENDFYPLITYIKSLADTFASNVFPPLVKSDTPSVALDENSLKQLITLAEEAEHQSQWLVALEKWAQVERRSEGPVQIRAALAHNHALVKLGEKYLAELMLKGMYLYPVGTNGPGLAKKAYDTLINRYTLENQDDKLLSLYAVEFSKTLNPALIVPLAERIFQNGYHRHAMLLCLLHPSPEKTASMLLYSSLKLSWRQMYASTMNFLKTQEEHSYFKALEMIQSGHGDDAEQMLVTAGSLGQELLQARLKAKDIAAMFKGNDHAEANRQWQEWRAKHPGPFVWMEPVGLIQDYAGTALVRSKARHLYSQYYRADVERPVTIAVDGPAEVRFTVRPIHSVDNTLPVNDWLLLQDGENRLIRPINNNFPSQTVELIGRGKDLAGQNEMFTYQVADGEHLLQLRGLGSSMLVQMEMKQPALGCEILPPFNRSTLATMQQHVLPETAALGQQGLLTCMQNDCLQVVTKNEVLSSSETQIRQGISKHPDVLFENVVKQTPNVQTTPKEKLKKEAIACVDAPLQNREQCLALLARYAEVASEDDKAWAVTQSMRIFLENPEQPELNDLLQRSALNGGWRQIDLMNAEEGLRFISYAGWQPDSPFLRIRKTMLPELEPNEEVLHNQNRLVFASSSTTNSIFTLRLRLVEVPYLQPAPLTVSIGLSGSPLKDITLDSSNKQQTVEIEVAAGENQLTFSLLSRYTNQFLAVQILPQADYDLTTNEPQQSPIRDNERAYYVASQKNPVKAHILGPAIIRVDELQGGNIHSHYRYLKENWQEILLGPSPGREQGLFRVYRWQPQPYEDTTVSLLRAPTATGLALPPMSMVDMSFAIQEGWSLLDNHSEALSGFGSLELFGKLVRRRDSEEDIGSDGLEDFFELDATHRFYAEDLRGFFESTALLRFREHGGSVAGLQEEFAWYPRFFPATIRFGAELFAQNPSDDTSFFHVPSEEAHFLVRASLSKQYDFGLKNYHIPALTVFKRFLSMTDYQPYQKEQVDQDIFTTYKGDHQDGMQLGDTLYHRPWLDTIWFAGVSLGLNEWSENLAPDNFRTRIGWQQLIGDLQAELTYKGAFYFQDRDRNDASFRDALQLDLSWDIWLKNSQRLQVTGMLQHDFDHNDQVGFIAISYHFNDTPDFRHFKPGVIKFKDIQLARQHQRASNPDEQGAQ